MDSLRNLWKRWKNRSQPPTGQLDPRTSNPLAMGLKPSDFTVDFKSSGRDPLSMSNDDSVTVGQDNQNVALVKRSHSLQNRARSSSVSSMVRAHQTSTLNPKDLSVKVEEAEEAREQPRIRSRSVAIPRTESTEATHQRQSQQPPVNHQVPLDGMSTCRLLVRLLQTGSEKLNFTPQAVELLREYVWLLEMFPNHTRLWEKLKVTCRAAVLMTPPPPPRINVFAHPDLLALIKMDDQGNWLVDSNTLSLLLYFLYRQKVKPMLEQENQERQELENLRDARRAHGN